MNNRTTTTGSGDIAPLVYTRRVRPRAVRLFIFAPLLLFAGSVSALSAFLVATPPEVLQGDPVLVEVGNAPAVRSVTFDKREFPVFAYQGKRVALVGVDLLKKPGRYTITARASGALLSPTSIRVLKRATIIAPLGIPEKLGGNTKQAEANLVTTLAKENAALGKVKATLLPLWSEPFIFPVSNPVVTDEYGYTRRTGFVAIPHRGVDVHADVGTPVHAINNGVVRLAREFTVYGNTVALDHGGGVISLSVHLSRIQVKVGQKVKRGEVIGLSGESGYALSPHLHLSVRIGGISVDPMKFFTLLGPRSSIVF